MNALVVHAVTAVRFAGPIGRALRWLSPALARLTVGLVFFHAGWGELHALDQAAGYFAALGCTPLPAAS